MFTKQVRGIIEQRLNEISSQEFDQLVVNFRKLDAEAEKALVTFGYDSEEYRNASKKAGEAHQAVRDNRLKFK